MRGGSAEPVLHSLPIGAGREGIRAGRFKSRAGLLPGLLSLSGWRLEVARSVVIRAQNPRFPDPRAGISVALNR